MKQPGQRKNITKNIFVIISNIEYFLFKSFSFAQITLQINICHKLHFHFFKPITKTFFTATTINIKSSEVITAIQRGTVDGFGFTDVSLPAIGLHTVTKYRVQPNFYQTNTVETVNLASWKALSQAHKDMLNRMAIEYEVTSVQYVEAERLKEEVQIKAVGVKDIVLTGKAKAKYLEIAHGEIWKELKNRSKYHDQLKRLLYHPGKANRQLKIKQQLDMKR